MAQRSTNNRRSRRSAEEEEPREESRRSRRSRDEDPEEEPPRRGRSRSREESPEEDEAPRRGRRSREADPEDEAPRRGRRGREEEPEDDAPSRGRRDNSSRQGAVTASGWGGFKKMRSENTTDFVKYYAYPEDQQEIIKFLDEDPFYVFAEHWIQERPKGKRKSFPCLGEGCPLCAIGERPRVFAVLNVVDLRDPDNPVVSPLRASPMVADQLEEFAKDSKTSPINRDDLYFAVKMTGKGEKSRVQINVTPVKERDLEEDWDIIPLTPEELDEFTLFVQDDVEEKATRAELREVADELD